MTSIWASRLVWGLWVIQLLILLVYVHRYAMLNPFVDEWAFVPALFGEQPTIPWLWQLHNEHRFPLPRIIYLSLFWTSGDLRTACYVNALGIAATTAWLILLMRRGRGRTSLTDLSLPALLMHPATDENLYMGYQLCFLLVVVLSTAFLAVVLSSMSPWRRAMSAGLIGLALLTCGAAGLVFGAAAIGWMLFVAIKQVRGWLRWLPIILIAIALPTYLWAYAQGYERPAHHPPSAGLFPSARIALQAFDMAFGPASTGMWPWFGAVVLFIGLVALVILAKSSSESDRRVGLFALLAAGPAVAFGIGWGRSGFQEDMGFAWRYGWLAAPSVVAAIFAAELSPSRWGQTVRVAALLITLGTLPVNVASAFLVGDRDVLPIAKAWKTDVMAGMGARELADRHYGDADIQMRLEIAEAVRLFRRHRYAYYDPMQEAP